MDEDEELRLFELADRILAVARLINATKEQAGESGTPVEIAVMRYIDRHPGTSARAAAEATGVVSSNFSRALRRLEARGLVRHEVDAVDARRVRLFPTEKAEEHLRTLRRLWSTLLDGIITDAREVDGVNDALERIEIGLTGRSRL